MWYMYFVLLYIVKLLDCSVYYSTLTESRGNNTKFHRTYAHYFSTVNIHKSKIIHVKSISACMYQNRNSDLSTITIIYPYINLVININIVTNQYVIELHRKIHTSVIE